MNVDFPEPDGPTIVTNSPAATDMDTPARAFAAVDAEALRTRSRADFVYDSLRDAIWDGRIAVGERVREEEVARNLGSWLLN